MSKVWRKDLLHMNELVLLNCNATELLVVVCLGMLQSGCGCLLEAC